MKYKTEYIIDPEPVSFAGDNLRTYTADFYRNCSNLCSFCPYQKIKKEDNLKVFVNIAGLYNLRSKGLSYPNILFGYTSDPYQPAEADNKIVRIALEMIKETGNNLTLFTRSELILRDLDILTSINQSGKLRTVIEFTSSDRITWKAFEKNCPSPGIRFHIMEKLARAGIKTGVGIMPLIPEILTKTDITVLVRSAKKAGASFVIYDFLELNENNSEAIGSSVKQYYPDREEKFVSSFTGGKLNRGARTEADGFLKELCDFHGLEIKGFHDEFT